MSKTKRKIAYNKIKNNKNSEGLPLNKKKIKKRKFNILMDINDYKFKMDE
jgi:hypothetical protein